MPQRYSEVLGGEPEAVTVPTTLDEGAAIVAAASATGKAIIPWGGGTGQEYGYPPRRTDILLDLSAMNRVLAHEPGDLTVTVEPGVTLAQLQKTLSAHHQFLPLDPPHADRATMGGIIATNAYGPSRVGHGTGRDWLIGLTLVDPQGRIIKGGGKVVKNVTGYDLPKLHIGALGTLGVIVEATFKVAPKPEASHALLFRLTGSGREAVAAFLAALTSRRIAPSLCLLNETGEGERHLVLVWSGPREVVEGECEAAAQLAEMTGLTAPQRLDSDFTVAEPQAEVLVRLEVPPADTWATHSALAAAFAIDTLQTSPFVGVVEAATSIEAATTLLRWAAERKVRVSVLHAPLTFRQQEGVPLWHPLPSAFPMMRRLKETLDPNATLNPGRFVGRL
ncbi:MAG: FAD-binding oxidoreductase [Cytophagales bacterium]|nr:FAD-binding oxidoreductase [Armatimonadota bacterium]